MFKHVMRKRENSQASSSSGSSDGDDELKVELEGGDGEEFAGFGDEDGQDGELEAEVEGDLQDEDGDDSELEEEELPANLPSLQDAITSPIFELSRTEAGRKTLVCIACPDKILREGSMQEVHLSSKSHLRRMERYTSYIKKNPSISEETTDPRAVTAFLDGELRKKKSGGAGFTLEPSGKRRKRRRNTGKKDGEKSVEETSDAKANTDKPARPKSETAMPEGDGFTEIADMKVLNSKQKRNLKQQQKKDQQPGSEEDADGVKTEGMQQASKPNTRGAKPNGAAVNKKRKNAPARSEGAKPPQKKKPAFDNKQKKRSTA